MEQMFQDFVVTFSLTCVDEAIARELYARMVTAELFRAADLPIPRDLEVTPRPPETFAGVDLVDDSARLHRALRRAAHKLGRYIEKAYLCAVSNNYVPLRTGVLDPLLRDPLDSTHWDGLAGTGPIEGSRPMVTHFVKNWGHFGWIGVPGPACRSGGIWGSGGSGRGRGGGGTQLIPSELTPVGMRIFLLSPSPLPVTEASMGSLAPIKALLVP